MHREQRQQYWFLDTIDARYLPKLARPVICATGTGQLRYEEEAGDGALHVVHSISQRR